MSGFVFVANVDGAPFDPALLARLERRLAFRGPDGSSAWRDGSVAMAAALLRSTIDAQGEQQPLSIDGRTWIVADARLDGRTVLLDALRARGCVCDPADADVALILHAYHTWGEACVDHLSGDLAFAIWDAATQRLVCVRDHCGVGMLFYVSTDRLVMVSNTLQAILAHPEVGHDLDETAIGDILLFGYHADATATVYESIRKLPPAHVLTWERQSGGRSQLETRRYWTLRGEVDARPRPAQEYVERFRRLFRQAVTDRLRTDHVATHLSGGLDSSSITATAHQVLGATGDPFTLRAYTIEYVRLFRDEEGDYADTVSRRLGIERESLPAEDFIERAPQDPPTFLPPEPGPLLDTLAEIGIQRRAATFARVLLQGFGGDPALYPRHRHWRDRLARGQVLGVIADFRASRALGLRAPLYLGRAIRGWTRRGTDAIPAPSGFADDFAARTAVTTRFREFTARALTADQQTGLATAPLWSHIFCWADPGFTGIPLRSRFPFFDLRLLQFLLTVPPVPWFVDKTLLREAMSGVLPEPVRCRPKTPLGWQPGIAELRQGWLDGRRDLARLPELAAYVDPVWLTKALSTPPIFLTDRVFVQRAIALAFWLRHRA